MSTWEQLLVPTPSCQVAWHGRNPPWGETFKQKLTNHIVTNETRRCVPPPLQTEPLQRQLFAHINLTYDAHSEAFDGRGCRPWYSYTTGTGSGQVTTVSASHVDDVPHISLSPVISLSFCLYLYCQLCFEMKNADNCNKSYTHTHMERWSHLSSPT